MRLTSDKLTFFRQSGWMVVATVASGIFMTAVHVVVSKPMLGSEYSLFSTLLRVFLLMGFPAGGLQVVFAQQAAAAITAQEQKKLAQTTRAVLRATFLIWLGIAAAVFLARHKILDSLKISNHWALWMTVLLGLASLWAPILRGLLQGRQNFAGLGWVLVLDGVGRFTAIVLIVHFGGQAAGGMTGALIGQVVSLALTAWLVRVILLERGEPFFWRPWLARVVPLTLGGGVILFMCNADVIYVRSVFAEEETVSYIPAAMIGLALVTFTTPLAAVMFPKIVQSVARTEKTQALQQALASTALLGAAAALACTLLPRLPLQIIYMRSPAYWSTAPLVPWFAWALLPLIVANVLISNLMARDRFRIVPWGVAVAVAYAATLLVLKERLVVFSARDLVDAPSFARKIQRQSDPVSDYLFQQLTPEQRGAWVQQTHGPPALQELLARQLNRWVIDPSFYNPARFAQAHLSEATRKLLERRPKGKDLVHLNRLLIHDAFPAEIRSSKDKLFAAYKKVIGTLGVFSMLLLLGAIWSTFRPGTAIRVRTE